MKLSTKIYVAANALTFVCVLGVYYNVKSVEAAQEAEAALVSAEVERQMVAAKELNCLATNIYHEARNDGKTGQRAVAWATLNRVASKKYPNTICDVVYQAELNENGIPIRNRCSFSWFCDGRSDEISDQAAWNVAQSLAEEVIADYGKETDPTNGSFMYHAYYVTPYWASSYEKQARIDSHIFYK